MNYISNLLIPGLLLIILLYGIKKKVDVYDVFVDGAKESFDMVLTMFPSLLGMILGINIFIKSGILNFLFSLIQPLLDVINIPIQVLIMAIMRPISGSSSLALLNSILEQFGPDGFIGTLASTIQGSTDTTFYILTLYFGSIGIKKIRYSLWVGLAADVIGIITSIILVNYLF